jgi:hypothetical protein
VNYRKLSPITAIEIIARGKGVDIRHNLNRDYGRGNWRKLKGVAIIEYEDGTVWRSELHWYQAHGIGRRLEKVKRDLERLS